MGLCWKRIIFELILAILLELAPASLGILGTVAEYLVELALETKSVSIQLVFSQSGQQYHQNLLLAAHCQLSVTSFTI